MNDDPTTKPTLETLLEMMRETRAETRTDLRQGFAEMRAEMEKLFDKVAVRLDRIESEVKLTHSEFYELRADFREFLSRLKEIA